VSVGGALANPYEGKGVAVVRFDGLSP